MDEKGIQISKVIEYKEDNTETKNKFIIIAKNTMLENLKSDKILQFFLDCTYKAVPPSKPKFKLLVLSGFDQEEKKTKLCCFILLHKEDENTFDNIFKHLKENYSFRPSNLMCDFSKTQINSIKNIFPECKLHCCFFHFSQVIWNKFRKFGMCGKNTYKDNSDLLYNIQLLCFIDKKNIKNLYKKIKQKFKNNKYTKLFYYFDRTWMGEKYPMQLWNFSDLVKEEKNRKLFNLTNNITENINKQLNKFLKRGKCSNVIFKEIVLQVITQFENKVINTENFKKKSDLLTFYIDNKKNVPDLLTNEKIEELRILYDEIKIGNINKEYSENMNAEYEIFGLLNDTDSECDSF